MNIQISKNVINNEEINSVNARELYSFLDLSWRFSEWFDTNKQMFEIDVDYTPYVYLHPQNKQELTDYIITLDMAKELAMMSKTEKGKQVRKYFIECEKQLREQNTISVPQTLPEALKLAYEQSLLIEELQPKADTFDKLIGADAIFSINQTAKLLGTGRNKLFAQLRDDCILMSDNLPYQAYVSAGYFVVKDTVIDRGVKSIAVSTTYVTTKGQVYLSKKYGIK